MREELHVRTSLRAGDVDAGLHASISRRAHFARADIETANPDVSRSCANALDAGRVEAPPCR